MPFHVQRFLGYLAIYGGIGLVVLGLVTSLVWGARLARDGNPYLAVWVAFGPATIVGSIGLAAYKTRYPSSDSK